MSVMEVTLMDLELNIVGRWAVPSPLPARLRMPVMRRPNIMHWDGDPATLLPDFKVIEFAPDLLMGGCVYRQVPR